MPAEFFEFLKILESLRIKCQPIDRMKKIGGESTSKLEPEVLGVAPFSLLAHVLPSSSPVPSLDRRQPSHESDPRKWSSAESQIP